MNREKAKPHNKAKNIESIYSLSPLQKGILFHSIYAPKSGAYCEQISLNLEGNVDIQLLEFACQKVIDRHPALRTLFIWENREKPLQVVLKQVDLPWSNLNWRELSLAEQKEQLRALLKTQREQGFQLNQAPLIECTLIKLGERVYKFIWTHHHILMDGWCLPIIFREILSFYEARLRGETCYLPTPPPYQRYIAWLNSQDKDAAISFWQQALRGFSTPTSLLGDRVRSQNESSNYQECELHLSSQVSRKLQTLVRKHHVTLSCVVQAVWGLLLSRYGGEKDVVFGVTVSGRTNELPDVENMVGLFINTLPLRLQIFPQQQLVPWLKEIQQLILELQQYSYAPLAEIQAKSELGGGTPLFESIVVFENYPVDSSLSYEESSLKVNETEVFEQNNYPLTVVASARDKLLIKISYDTLRFKEETIERILGHLQTLFLAVVENPQRTIAELPLLSGAEQHQLLVEWNDTQREYPSDNCLHGLFEAQVERTPDSIAIVFEQQQLTYQQLNARANQLAHHLRRLGVGPEVLVGICVERSLDMVVGLLGILKAGGAYVPLDPNYPQARLDYILSDAGVAVLLTEQSLLGALPSAPAQVVCFDTDRALIEQHSQANLEVGVASDKLAYVIYTSGSTGQPKGVQIEHHSVVNFLKSMGHSPGITAADIFYAVTTISFDIAALELYLPLSVGAQVIVASRATVSDPERLLCELVALKSTVMQATPATWQMLLAAGWSAHYPLKVLCGGEALSTQLARQILATGSELWNLYGPTEATIWSTLSPVDAKQAVSETEGKASSIGRPIANTQIYILDEQHHPVPIGVAGELYIGGDGLARGYLNRPELTQAKFVRNPFNHSKFKVQNSKLYRTGDLARYLPNGDIEFLGRIDYQVKIRGFRIELGEIESVLREHPRVHQAVVMAREDMDDDKRLVAYVVADEESLTTLQLRQFVASKLPGYMVPGSFVLLATLPLTPNGKVDRKALPAPDETIRCGSAYVAPRTPEEEIMANIFAGVLGVQSVGIDDNFFEMGGHSLLATQLISRLRSALNIEMPLRAIFESPTIVQLGQTVSQLRTTNQASTRPPIRPRTDHGKLPLSFAQQRLWFLDQLDSDSLAYSVPAAVSLVGLLNIAILKQVFNEIVRRHEILRTTFSTVEGQPIQLISPSLNISLPVVNLGDLPEVEQKGEVQRLIHQWCQKPFDLTQGPLLRVMLLQLKGAEHLLLFNLHHIASDGWSMGVLVKEIAVLYEVFSQGQPSPLPELPIQYADFAVWQRQWLQGEVLETQLAYWKQRLGANPSVLELPTDQPPSSSPTSHGTKHLFSLSQRLTEKIKALSKQEGVTLFMTLLGAFKALLHSYKDQEDILVGMPITNRSHAEIEGLVGLFLNTLVLRTDLSGNPTFREILRRVREVTLGAYTHQDLPFEKLVGELKLERDLNSYPLFRVWFVFNNALTHAIELPGLTLDQLEVETGTVRHDLKLELTETAEGLKGFFEYKTDLFEASTIALMVELFELIIDKVVQNSTLQLSELGATLKEAQQQQQLSKEKEFQEARRKKLSKLGRRAIRGSTARVLK